MTSKTFVSGTTIDSDWLNDVDAHAYDQLAGAHSSDHVSFTPAGTGADATNVQSKLQESVSVADFGEFADGVGNDTAAVVAALTRLAGGGELHFTPNSNYLISGVTLPSGIILKLNGSTIKQLAGTVNTPMFSATTKKRIRIENGAIDGNKTNVSGNLAGAFQFVGSENIKIDNVEFANVRRICINLDSSKNVKINNVTATTCGVAGAAIGQLIECQNGCKSVFVDGAEITNSDGVGAKFHAVDGLVLKNYRADTIGTDNGLTIDTSTNVECANITTTNCANQGFEFSSTIGFSLRNIKATGNAVYGFMLNVFTGAAEQAASNGVISGVVASGNGTTDMRLIGAKRVRIENFDVGTTNVLNSGTVTTDGLDLQLGKSTTLALTAGTNIGILDVETTTFSASTDSYTRRFTRKSPVVDVPTKELLTTEFIDISIPNVSTGNQWTGLLIVNSVLSAVYTQNTSQIFHISKLGTVFATSISRVDGTVARAMTVTLVGESTIRITNATGSTCTVSASFFGNVL